MFSFLRLCYVSYGEIDVKNGYSCVRFFCHNILFLRSKCGEGSPWSVQWDGFSVTQVRRIHGPFEPVFMPNVFIWKDKEFEYISSA